MSDAVAVSAPCSWHQSVFEQILSQHHTGRLPHALLLHGVAGIGKQQLTKALAETLLCDTPRGGIACGMCHPCQLAVAGTHPDFFQVQPEEDSRAIKIDQIRLLTEFSARTPALGGLRIMIVTPAEAMNRNAQNALLKTLEEPGPGTLLMLVSHQPASLLATVRSRCQQWTLPTPAPDVAQEWLGRHLTDPGLAAPLLMAAGGAPLRALAIEESDSFRQREKLLQALVDVARSPQTLTSAARLWSNSDVAAVLDAAWQWTHEALRLAAGVPGRGAGDAAIAPLLAQLADQAGRQRLLRLADAILRARNLLRGTSNVQPGLLMEQLLLSFVGVDVLIDEN